MGKSNEMFISIQEELLNTILEVEEGELSNLDGLIKMREAKSEADKILEIVKDFEDKRINEISSDAEQFKGKYLNYEIKHVNGRKSYVFKGIPEIEEATKIVTEKQDKYKSAFDGFQKGTVQTTEENGIIHWIDENGELKPFPELTIGKSYLTVKKTK